MTETTQTLSLGQQFQKAREALNLSIAQVAEKTNLKKNHLEALEQDIFILPSVPPAFVRGYVGSYLRFLRLPEELANSVHYGEVTIPKEVKRAAPIPVKNNHKSQTRWVKCLTWLVLLGAIGMTLAWWWQEYKKDQASSEQLVVNVQNEATISPAPETIQPQAENAVPVQLEPKSEENAATVSVNNTEITPTAAEEVKVEALPQAVEQVRIDTPVQPIATEQTQDAVNVLQQTAVAEQPKAEEQTAEQPQAVGNDELRIEITNAQSWITVRNAKKKKLAEKLYNSGEVLTFNGNEQYSLTVGAPANVKIYYKGQQVPLKVDGRVARFKLPLAN